MRALRTSNGSYAKGNSHLSRMQYIQTRYIFLFFVAYLKFLADYFCTVKVVVGTGL
jgi:hypothetical protein